MRARRLHSTSPTGRVAASSPSGMTLLELLVAVAITALVLTSLYTTFRTAARAHKLGMATTAQLQTLRYLTDILSRDVRSVFYKDRVKYNKNRKALEDELEKLMMQRDMGRNANEERIAALEELLGDTHSIDLTFSGAGSGFSFVRFQPSYGEMATQPWGLARVEYSFSGSQVIRSERPIFVISRINPDLEDVIALESTELREVLADNVTNVSVHYGYFFDGEWLEAQDWASGQRRLRNPLIDFDEEDPLAKEMDQFNRALPDDGLPAYIDIDLTVEAPNGGRRPLRFRQMVSLLSSQETFLPVPEDFEDSDGYYGRREAR